MENTTKSNNGFFSILYRTRVKVSKGNTTILNLSALFSVISLLTAPWLVIIGAIVALVLGYRFSIDRNGADFEQNFDTVIRNAAGNVKQVVDSVTDHDKETKEDDQ